eukprot:3491052-Rhodomonas_salina.4
MLVVAADVARLLRENLVRCFQLVLASQGSVQGSKDNEVIKREALRLYFEQQRRVLAVVCRLLRDPFVIDMTGEIGDQVRETLDPRPRPWTLDPRPNNPLKVQRRA